MPAHAPDQPARSQCPPRRSQRVALAAATAAVLVGGAVPAIAAAGTGPVTYYACVTARTGAIKIVSASAKCHAGQRKISWNKTGPRGPAGPPGPAGVVTGFETNQSGTTNLIPDHFFIVAELKLPANGNYLVTARAEADDAGSQTADAVQCSLTDAKNAAIDTTVVTLTGSPSGVDDLVVTGFTKGGGMMALQCLDNTGQGFIGTYTPTVMTAIRVNSFVEQSPARGHGALRDVLPRIGGHLRPARPGR